MADEPFSGAATADARNAHGTTAMVDERFCLIPMGEALRRCRESVERDLRTERCPRVAYSRPISVHWEFTNLCNLRCPFCYNSAGTLQTKRLPESRLLEVADELVEAGVMEVTFSGGEVFTEQALFWKLADRLRRAGTLLRLITNGWFVNDRIARRLAEYGFRYVTLSLDGPEPQTHDRLRGVAGSCAAPYGHWRIWGAMAFHGRSPVCLPRRIGMESSNW